MAARAQPSEYEIQREVEALRDIRRRSTTPGALAIDPDLPNQSPPSSPTSTYWSGKARSSATTDTSVSGTSQESDSYSTTSGSNSSEAAVNPNNPADDPFHLFWVPASVHPEIAPAEFKAFLKEHARNPLSDGSDVSLGRAPSLASRSSLSRKRSMLSRQYQPKEGDVEQDEKIVPLRRNRSFVQQTMPQLTISDLQKLEELAEEASESDDPSRLRSVLRRSISLNLSPTALEQMDSMPDMGDEADVPIIVPPPGQILRRTARTKIRKPGLPGEGAAHRFGASRRGRRNSGDGRLSVEHGSNENSESECSSPRRQTLSDDGLQNTRPDSFSEEASIFDAYAHDEEEDVHALFTTPSPMVPELSIPPQSEDPPHLAQPEIQTSLLEALGPILDLEQPQPQRPIVYQTPKEPAVSDLSRSPSPEPVASDEPVQTPPVYAQKPFQPAPPSSIAQPIHSIQAQLTASVGQQQQQQQQQQRKEKDKKGLFGKWGSDKTGKKSKADKEREREREKEKEGFFGSFFGGKKKQDESSPITNSAGREAAQALLGASKSSKNYVPPTSPGLVGGSPNFSRYPIHVERAIYRLSHIKLANPRRPLYEQVLISNLMFWYLGVINKAQNSTTPTAGEPTQAEKEEKEKEQKEREKVEKERLERERLEKEQKEREMEMKKKESGKRGSLTKTPVGGPPGGRRAEMPVKGPQYEIQQQVMQKEYSNGGYNGQGPRNPGNIPNGQPYSRNQSSPQPQQLSSQPYPAQAPAQYPPVSQYPPSQNQPYPNSPPRPGQPYDSGGSSRGLPPGAMAPANMSPGPQPRSPKMGNFQQQHQPPPNNRGPYPVNTSVDNVAQPPSQRSPARSLSANAIPSGGPPMNGGLRKGNSAHAVTTYDPHRARGRPSEEDDTPLAVYQQQQRR